ncbi:MAG: aminotransferase class I/II-fold pyridoxal phosphate-dependent enzyme [Pirellulales bacterium]|nr:aminotransferase class I/II-fold pyridoxal phosphate-dependent enzyme [Pirellulales bacterium]
MGSDQRPGSFYGPATLVEMLRHRAAHQPSDLVFAYLVDGETDEQRLTYAELDRRARVIAGWLQSQGLAGERALLLYPPGLDFVTGFFGCLYAGVMAVTAYPPRMNRSLGRIQAIATDAGARVALTTESVHERVTPWLPETPDLLQVEWVPTDRLPDAAEAYWTSPDISADTLAFLQYTSGSTGTPKGVMLSHANLLHNCALIAYSFEHTRSSSGVFWLPSYHDMGLVGGILQPMYVGRHSILMSPMAFLQKPLRWLQAISRYRATTSGGPNFAYDLCLRKVTPEQRDQLDLSSWTVAFNGAEPVRNETLERFAEYFAPCGFRAEAFYPCYGLAEATLLVSGGQKSWRPKVESFDLRRLEHDEAVVVPAAAPHARSLVSCGNDLPDQRIVIVDPHTAQPLAEGRIGEIWVTGPSIAQGYWERPAETEQTFRARLADGSPENYLRTGDLGFISAGELYVTGRVKDLIIVRGVNHYPQDIELTVEHCDRALRANSGAAFTLEADGRQHLVLVQELERGFAGEIPRLFETIREAVTREHELVLDAVVLVKAGSIPKTSSGKIQRHATRQAFVKGALKVVAQWSAGSLSTAFVEGESEREEVGAAMVHSTTTVTVARGSALSVSHNATIASTHAKHGHGEMNGAAKGAIANSSAIGGASMNGLGGNTVATGSARANGKGHANGRHANGHVANGHAKGHAMESPARANGHSRRAPAAAMENGRRDAAHAKTSQHDPLAVRSGQPVNSESTNGRQFGAERGASGTLYLVMDLVRTVAGQRAEGMTLDTTLAQIGLDSLERIELQTVIEEHFGARLPEDLGPQLETIRDIVGAVEQHLLAPETQPGTSGEIPEEHYRFEMFGEYVKLKQNREMLEGFGLVNPYFNVHEGVTRDTALIGGRELINFANYNYVGMSGDPAVTRAAIEAVERYGTSVSASRLVSGEKVIHGELERALANFVGAESAIVYVGGHTTNVNTIGHLFGAGDLVLHDALAHNSIVQGAVLSGAKRRAFPHNDWQALDRLLADLRPRYRRVLVAIEGVYSMDGDIADLPRFLEVKKRHKAFLLVDEAHSAGVLGRRGRGIGEHFGIDGREVDLWMGTLSKSFGSCGGYIAGNQAVVEYLKYTSPGFVFSVGITPANAAAALASIEVLAREPQRVSMVRDRAALFLKLARARGLNTGLSQGTPIVPIILGNSIHALQLSRALFERGVNVQPILYPAVEESAARLRFFINSSHSEEQIRLTVDALAEEAERIDPRHVSWHQGARLRELCIASEPDWAVTRS